MCSNPPWEKHMHFNTLPIFIVYFLRQKTDMPAPEHRSQLTAWQGLCQVERRFHILVRIYIYFQIRLNFWAGFGEISLRLLVAKHTMQSMSCWQLHTNKCQHEMILTQLFFSCADFRLLLLRRRGNCSKNLISPFCDSNEKVQRRCPFSRDWSTHHKAGSNE